MDSAYAYSGKTVTIDGEDLDVPEFSVYEEKCYHCGCHIAYFPEINQYYCNEWEVSITYPLIVIILTALAYSFGIWSVYSTSKGALRWILITIGTIIYIVWWVAFLQSMFRSAGYLPWYWFVEKRTKYTYEEQMGGIITNPEQTEFCNTYARPERAILSTKARRIVLRADHICKWIGNWVGLKNYRYFFTQLMWFIMLFLFFFVVVILQIVDLAKNGWTTTVPRIAIIILIVPVGLFFVFFMIVLVRHIRYLVTNNTTVHELKSERSGDYTNPYDLGCWQNCIETLGPEEYCPVWFCPCPIPRTNDGFVWKRNDRVLPFAKSNIKKQAEENNDYFVGNNDQEETDSDSDSEVVDDDSSSSFFIATDSSDSAPPGNQPQKFKQEDDVIEMEQPIQPPMFSEFYDGFSEKEEPAVAAPKEVETPTSRRLSRSLTKSRDGFFDTLVDKTVDGEDDKQFDAYIQGTKTPPLPSQEPVSLSIKETVPRDKKRTREHIHVKKVRVPIMENGKETGRYQVRKIKVVDKIDTTETRNTINNNDNSYEMYNIPLPAPPTYQKSPSQTKLIPVTPRNQNVTQKELDTFSYNVQKN